MLKFGGKSIGFGGKVQPAIVSYILSGPLRRTSFKATSRLPCRVARLIKAISMLVVPLVYKELCVGSKAQPAG